MSVDCPICLQELTDQSGMLPFTCGHPVCVTCDGKMVQQGDNRCPVCRAPRIGMTVDEAEPRPTFNAPSFGALFTENMLHSMPRPNTGHMLFFPTETPIELPNTIPGEFITALEQQTEPTEVGIVHRSLVNDLINVPGLTISQWRRRAAARRRVHQANPQSRQDSAR